MVINQEYDLTKSIQTAIKAKAPYVGVSMPGHAPLIFKRALLAGALKGVKPAYIEVEAHPNGVRTLTIEGTAGPRTRTRCRIISIDRKVFYNWQSEARKAMDKWKPTMAPKVKSAPKSTKFDKAIIVLEKRLAKLGECPHLVNPTTVTGYASSDRESCQKWYAQKSLRGQVGSLGKKARTGKLDSREFYAAMDALPGIGKATRYSELDTRQKESLHNQGFFGYANPKVLWRFMPSVKTWCGGKPYGLQALDDGHYNAPRWGAERYEPVLEWKRQRKELLLAIESIKGMQVAVMPTPNAELSQAA